MPENPQSWYIVKDNQGTCQIVDQIAPNTEVIEQWGPFKSWEDAIARRVGLIRSGKCKPK